MKKLFTLLACAIVISGQAQTILYSETFEGVSPTFTLNTSDASSNTSAYNNWVINNSYNGGTYTEPCYGVSAPVAATPAQPSGITNYPNSKYMHVLCSTASTAGITNANFLSSDGGIVGCVNDEAVFAKMTGDISTAGQTGVTLSYYYMCGGAATNYGQVYYSTNGGGAWNLLTTNILGVSSWTQATVTNAAFDNQTTLRFGFRFVNNFTFSAVSDPPLCIDDVVISVPASNTITTGNITGGSPYCAGVNLIVPYTITGTFVAGNTFNAELSDAVGSFASPTTIGSVTTISAGNINCNIPANTVTGSGYQIRVRGSSPATTGSSSGPITINALPVPAPSNTGPYCAGNTISLSAAAGSIDYDWTGPNAYSATNTQNPTITSATVAMSGVYTVTATNAAGCTSVSTTTVSVLSCAGIEDEVVLQVSIYPNPAADVFTISLDENMYADSKITLFNLVGEVVHTMTPNQPKTMISTESLGLKAGIYLVQVKYKGQNKVVRLIVK